MADWKLDGGLGRLSVVPPHLHMLALQSTKVPLDLKSQAGLEGCQRGAPIAVLTLLFLILHLLSISSVLVILGQRSIVSGVIFARG